MIKKTKFKDLTVYINRPHKDYRGYLKELLKEKKIKKKFVFSILSFSKKNVVRGLHIQTKESQGKYVSVLKGKIFDVAVDLRKNSKTFGKYYSCILSESNSKSVYIPPGFAHGFLTLEKENYVLYNCTQYRNSKFEKSIRFDDKNLKIKWPSANPIISNKDKKAMSFTEYKNKNL
tara:strand:- start:227 stop:751 length:525 start_codon:yes stop_codon:yes gene_type:complete